MKKIKKSHTEGDSTSFNDLPDDIVYQILSKLSDLKTLCICELVCKHFYHTVLQVEAISLTYPLVVLPDMKLNVPMYLTLLRSFTFALSSLKKFTRVKSICIQLSSPWDNPLLFKWKIKFGNKLDSLIFLSPNSVHHNQNLHVKESNQEEDLEMKKNKSALELECWMDAMINHHMLLLCIKNIPLLESISIKDSGKRRMISYSGEKFTQMKSCLTPPYETVLDSYIDNENILLQAGQCYVESLKLPISGFVMKGVTLILRERNSLPDDMSLLNTHMLDDDFEDEEKGAYNEAMKEMLKELKRQKQRPTHVV